MDRRDWLVTNGLGGYASGTVAGGSVRDGSGEVEGINLGSNKVFEVTARFMNPSAPKVGRSPFNGLPAA